MKDKVGKPKPCLWPFGPLVWPYQPLEMNMLWVIWCDLLGTQPSNSEGDARSGHTVIILACRWFLCSRVRNTCGGPSLIVIFCRWSSWCWSLQVRVEAHIIVLRIRNRLAVSLGGSSEEDETQHKENKEEALHCDWKQVWCWFDASVSHTKASKFWCMFKSKPPTQTYFAMFHIFLRAWRGGETWNRCVNKMFFHSSFSLWPGHSFRSFICY